MARLKLAASAVFSFGYLLFHAIYPTVNWRTPSETTFAWTMFSGRSVRPTFVVTFADGSTRQFTDPLRPGSPVRTMSASVDEWRFVPPHVCTHWPGAREVRAFHSASGREEVTVCPSAAR